MQKNTRVFNETRKWWMKYSQALRAVENCACAWVEFGAKVRDLTLAESIAARHAQAKKREGLIYWVEGKEGKLIAKPYYAEQPGLVYRPTEHNQAQARQGFDLVRAANQFAALQTA